MEDKPIGEVYVNSNEPISHGPGVVIESSDKTAKYICRDKRCGQVHESAIEVIAIV